MEKYEWVTIEGIEPKIVKFNIEDPLRTIIDEPFLFHINDREQLLRSILLNKCYHDGNNIVKVNNSKIEAQIRSMLADMAGQYR